MKMSQQNISYRVNVIRTKYPEMLQTNSTNNTNENVCTNTLQTVQTKNTNTSQTVQIIQTSTKESVCETDSVCQSSVKPGESKKKFSKEDIEKMGFNF